VSVPPEEEQEEPDKAGPLPFHPVRALFAIVMAGPRTVWPAEHG
jgi:hypothetical protein